MDIDPALKNLVVELGNRMGLGNLALDDDGSCAFSIDNRTTINVQQRNAEESLWFYSDLGVPGSGPDLYADLLQANLFWRSTLGATLSLSGDDPPHVVIALPVAWRGLDGAQLAQRLERFINTVEDWAELVAQTDEDDEATAGKPADGDSSMVIRA